MPKVVKESDLHPNNPVAISEGRYYIYCPGCYEQARLTMPEENERVWNLYATHCFSDKVHGFNGDMEKPTLTPSLLVRGSKTCHSFVVDGKIQFLHDCDHPLAGQTVELLDVPAS